MSNYYCLVAGLPELSLEDSKLSYTVASFKSEIYSELSRKDKALVDLFYLKFDNRNLLALLYDKEAETDDRGNYQAQELLDLIRSVKEGEAYPKRRFPDYFPRFVSEVLAAGEQDRVRDENRLAALYFDYASKAGNRFVASWFDFNLSVNNVLTALTARKYKWDVAPLIVGHSPVCEALRSSSARDFGLGGELEVLDALVKISELTDLVEKERKTDLLRWNWMEEATFFDFFSVERIFVFLLQLEMIERWIALDKETGRQMFRNIIDQLKNEVQIPEEFR